MAYRCNRINQEILKDIRADYGKNVILNLSEQLKVTHDTGYDKTALSRMIKFSKLFPDQKIVATLSQQLSWSHVIQIGIILCSDKDQEDIEYLEMDNSEIHVAQYLTQLPPKKILEAKLKKAIAIGREKYERLKLSEKGKNEDGKNMESPAKKMA